MKAGLLRKLGSHYIVVMMLVTRLIGSVGGTLTIYYVGRYVAAGARNQRALLRPGRVCRAAGRGVDVAVGIVGNTLLAGRVEGLGPGLRRRFAARPGGRPRGGPLLRAASPARGRSRSTGHDRAGLRADVLVGPRGTRSPGAHFHRHVSGYLHVALAVVFRHRSLDAAGHSISAWTRECRSLTPNCPRASCSFGSSFALA